MKILAVSREIPPVDWESLAALLQEEASVLHNLYLEEQVREFYFTDSGEAVLILEAASIDEARKALGLLPLVKAGAILFDFMELHPYSGFTRLFNR